MIFWNENKPVGGWNVKRDRRKGRGRSVEICQLQNGEKSVFPIAELHRIRSATVEGVCSIVRTLRTAS